MSVILCNPPAKKRKRRKKLTRQGRWRAKNREHIATYMRRWRRKQKRLKAKLVRP